VANVNYASILDHANDARTRIREVTSDELGEPGLNGAVFLDVREEVEFRSGHIADAIHLPRLEIKERISAVIPDKTTPIVAYCAIGHRSAIAADTLRELGYQNVVSLKGGLKDYTPAAAPRKVA
jgi:rhodanese-related sulfurtransferase